MNVINGQYTPGGGIREISIDTADGQHLRVLSRMSDVLVWVETLAPEHMPVKLSDHTVTMEV